MATADLQIAIRVAGHQATTAALKSVSVATHGVETASKAASGSLGRMGSTLGSTGRTAAGAVGHITGLTGATRALDGAAKVTGVSFGKMATAVAAGQIAASAFVATTRGLGDLFKSATSQAMDFEKGLSAIAAVSGATASEMATLKQLALDLGAATSFSATEAAQGIEELVKAGVSIKDIMGGAGKASLDLAAAGAVSVADAAEIASNAMNAFSIKGSEMGKVADTIAGAANASAISVTDFKFSLSAVGAVAAAAGLSFNDTAVAIAELGQAGIKGSDAGTSLKAFIAGLTPSSKAAKEAMKELGLITKGGGNAFFDASGKMKSMAEIQQILAKATKGLTEQQKLMAFETIFGSDAIRAASVLSKAGAKGYEEMAGAIGKVSAGDVAEKRLDNLAGSVEKFKGSLSTAAITIGMGFMPGLKRIVDGATGLLNAWMPAISAFAEKIPAAFDAFIDKVLSFGPVIRQAFVEAGQIVGAFVGLELDDYAAGWETWGGIVMRVLDLAGQALSDLWQTAREAFGSLAGSGQGALPMVREALAALVPIVMALAKTWFTSLAETVRWLVQDILPPLVSIVKQTAGFFVDTLIPAFVKTQAVLRVVLGESLRWLADVGWPALLNAARFVINYLTANVVPLLPTLARDFRELLGQAILWVANVGWPTLVQTARDVSTWITGTGIPALQQLTEWLDRYVKPVVLWLINEGWPMLVSAGSAVSDWVTNTALPVLTSLVEWLGPKVSAVVSWLIDTGWPLLVSAAMAVSDWIVNEAVPRLTDLWTWLEEKTRPIVQWLINEGWPMLTDAAKKVTAWINEEAIPRLTDLWKWLEENIRPIVQWFINEGWPKLQETGETVRKLWQDMVTWVKELWAKLKERGVWDDYIQGLKDLWEAGKTIVNTFWPGMKKGAEDIAKELPPANVVIGVLVDFAKIGATTFRIAALGLKSMADSIKAIKDAGVGMPEWIIRGLLSGTPVGIGAAIGRTVKQGSQETIPNVTNLPSKGVMAEWGQIIAQAAAKYGVPPEVIAGIMEIESTGRRDAQSPMNKDKYGRPIGRAQGLMQVMPFHFGEKLAENGEATAEQLARMQEPLTNVMKGAEILAREFQAFGSWDKAAAAYFGAIDRSTGQITGGTDVTGTSGNKYVNLFNEAMARYREAITAINGVESANMSATETINQNAAALQNVDQVIIAVATGLYQAREALVTTGEANVVAAQNALPLIDALEKQGAISGETATQLRGMADEILAAGKTASKAVEPTEALSDEYDGAARAAHAAAEKAKDLANKTGAVGEAAHDAKQDVLDLAASFNKLPDWFTPTGKGGGSLFDPKPRAAGGPVTAGMPYIVGERRPELFVPNQNGTILSSVPGGGGTVVVNVQAGLIVHERDLDSMIAASVTRALKSGNSVFGS